MTLELKDEKEFSALLVNHKEQILLLLALSEQTGISDREQLIQEYLSTTLPKLPRQDKSYNVRLNHRTQRRKRLKELYDNHLFVV
jgi:hypothetical protein